MPKSNVQFIIIYSGTPLPTIVVGLFATREAAHEHLLDEHYVESETGWHLPGCKLTAEVTQLVDITSAERRQAAAIADATV